MNRLSVLALIGAFFIAGCDPQPATPSATQRERQATEQIASQASVTVGVPAIKNFTEKRQLKAIYELRDQANLTTYTYIVDLNGKRHKVCPSTSVGFGIPYATQYTNPQMVTQVYSSQNYMYEVLPQPDPNALFSPASADATWVICLNKGELSPTYVEPRIEVYTFEMSSVD
jgi:hypothetical protein